MRPVGASILTTVISIKVRTGIGRRKITAGKVSVFFFANDFLSKSNRSSDDRQNMFPGVYQFLRLIDSVIVSLLTSGVVGNLFFLSFYTFIKNFGGTWAGFISTRSCIYTFSLQKIDCSLKKRA